MKKSLLTSLLLLVCTMLAAQTVGRQKAMQAAAAHFGADTPMQLVATGGGEEPAYYVFNAQRAEQGFVIVGGDDQATRILGYSDQGAFDETKLPPQLSGWLEGYQREIEMVRSGRAEAAKAPSHATIAPLIKTQWDQDAPYNNLVPLIDPADPESDHCATGCVATAMAQILKFWAYDKATPAIPAYTKGGRSLEALPARSFNYGIMKDTYSYSDNSAAATEVATLMLYCGQAVEMDYGEESAARVDEEHFHEYFGYNKNAITLHRGGFKADRWDELVYGELEAGRPLIYSGLANDGGHQFICDGFKDGLYHINWGWGGYCDGYFVLAIMDPGGSGIGGSSSGDGFTMRQDAIFRLQPETTAESGEPEGYNEDAAYKYYGFDGGAYLQVNSASVEGNMKAGAALTLKANVTNIGQTYVSDLYLRTETDDVGAIAVNLEPGETGDVEIHFSIEDAGTYTLTLYGMYFKDNNQNNPQKRVLKELSVTIENHQNSAYLEVLTASGDGIVNEEYDNVTQQWVVKGPTMNCEIEIRNKGSEDYDDELLVGVAKAELDAISGYLDRTMQVPVQIAAGATKKVSFQVPNLDAGYQYWLILYFYNADGTTTEAHQTYAYPIIEDTSGIQGVRADAASDEGAPVFDLRGRRVGTTGDQLPKGLYVVKGKKFLVK